MKKTVAPNEPIVITEVRVDGRLVGFEEPFDAAADNWAENVTLIARNVSNKTISGVKIIIAFPTGPKKQVAFVLRYEGEAQPNTEIKLAGLPQYDKLRPFLAERAETPNFFQASMTIDQVFFTDNTLWAQGTVFRKNATTGEWELVSILALPVQKRHHARSGLRN